MDALLDSAHASRAPHLAPCARLGAYRSTLGHAAGQIWGTRLPLAAFGTNAAQGAQSSLPVFRVRSGARTDEVEFRQENRPVGGFVPAGV